MKDQNAIEARKVHRNLGGSFMKCWKLYIRITHVS